MVTSKGNTPAMKEKQFELTESITDNIRDINSNPAYSAEEKKAEIRKLSGGSMEQKLEFMKKNFRRFD